jgi:DNA replication protein DnaC
MDLLYIVQFLVYCCSLCYVIYVSLLSYKVLCSTTPNISQAALDYHRFCKISCKLVGDKYTLKGYKKLSQCKIIQYKDEIKQYEDSRKAIEVVNKDYEFPFYYKRLDCKKVDSDFYEELRKARCWIGN